MKYHVVPTAECLAIAAEFLRTGPRPLAGQEINTSGSGPQVEIEEIEQLSNELRSDLDSFVEEQGESDRDRFEGRIAGPLHQQLRDLETTILDDPGFWRYLTLAHFWWYVTWREAEGFAKRDPGKYRKYIDGNRPTECVVLRTFLRGQAVREGDDYSLAGAIKESADFWRSHVLRVSTGAVPAVSRALAKEHLRDRLPTSELRPFARRLNRVSTNVLLPLLEEEEAAELVKELRE